MRRGKGRKTRFLSAHDVQIIVSKEILGLSQNPFKSHEILSIYCNMIANSIRSWTLRQNV